MFCQYCVHVYERSQWFSRRNVASYLLGSELAEVDVGSFAKFTQVSVELDDDGGQHGVFFPS